MIILITYFYSKPYAVEFLKDPVLCYNCKCGIESSFADPKLRLEIAEAAREYAFEKWLATQDSGIPSEAESIDSDTEKK